MKWPPPSANNVPPNSFRAEKQAALFDKKGRSTRSDIRGCDYREPLFVLEKEPHLVAANGAPTLPTEVETGLLSDKFYLRPTLRPARDRWLNQYSASRPLDVRLAPDRTLHDRDIIVDGTAAYSSTQSLNAVGARSHATIMRFDPDTTKLKVEVYENIWKSAIPL
jgi:hypothetical protein